MNQKCRDPSNISIETSDIKLLKIKCRYLWIITLYGIMINWEKTKITIGTFCNGKTKIAINIFASFLSSQNFDTNSLIESF